MASGSTMCTPGSLAAAHAKHGLGDRLGRNRPVLLQGTDHQGANHCKRSIPHPLREAKFAALAAQERGPLRRNKGWREARICVTLRPWR